MSNETEPPSDPPFDKETLYDTTIRVYLREGLEHATLQDVADELGVPLQTITSQMLGKEEPVVEACRWYYLKFGRQLRATMALHSNLNSAMEGLLSVFIEMCFDQFAKSQGKFKHSLYDLGLVNKKIEDLIKDMQVDWQEQIHEKFSQARHELIDPSEADNLAVFYITMIEGIYEMIKYGTPEEQVYRLIQYSLDPLEQRMKTNMR